MSIFVLPQIAVLVAANPLPLDIESVRVVSYYHSRFYAGAEPPFTLSPRQVLPKDVITDERITSTLLGRSLVIEVCPFIRASPDMPWRVPTTLEERKRSCEVHGSFDQR